MTEGGGVTMVTIEGGGEERRVCLECGSFHDRKADDGCLRRRSVPLASKEEEKV